MTQGGRRRRTWAGWLSAAFLLSALLCFLPLFGLLPAGTIATAAGCRLDEGGVYPCVIAGTDYGHTLNVLFVLGWLLFATGPLGLAALAASLIAGFVWLFPRRPG